MTSSPLSVMLRTKVWAEPGAACCAAAIAESVASRLPVAGDQRPASSEIGGGVGGAPRRPARGGPGGVAGPLPAGGKTTRVVGATGGGPEKSESPPPRGQTKGEPPRHGG